MAFELSQHTNRLDQLAPSGCSVKLHIRFAQPLFEHQTFSQEWITHYSDMAFALRDPFIGWGIETNGATRWSELPVPDPYYFRTHAANYGLKYGLAVSIGARQSRTIATAARSDREYSDAEIVEFERLAQMLHDITEPPKALTEAQIEALQLVADGFRHTAAAARLGISESAFKARLAAARNWLQARTTAEAVQRARDYRLL